MAVRGGERSRHWHAGYGSLVEPGNPVWEQQSLLPTGQLFSFILWRSFHLLYMAERYFCDVGGLDGSMGLTHHRTPCFYMKPNSERW